MKTTKRISVPIPRPVHIAARWGSRALLAVAGTLVLGVIADLAGTNSPARTPPVLYVLQQYTAATLLATGIFLVLAIAAVVILRAPEPPAEGGGTRLLLSVAMSGVPGVLLVGVLLVIVLRPAWCPGFLCPAPQLRTNPQCVHDQSLELCLTAVQSAVYAIPGDPAQYTLNNLPESIGALRIDQPTQPPYRVALGVDSLQQGRFGLIIEQVALVVAGVPATPQPLNVWVAGSPLDYHSNPFRVVFGGQESGALLPATYVPFPQGHVQLAPGEADELDLQVLSQVPADLIFQVQVTYRVADQSQLHTLTWPARFEVIFSTGSNWHLYQLQNGHLVVNPG